MPAKPRQLCFQSLDIKGRSVAPNIKHKKNTPGFQAVDIVKDVDGYNNVGASYFMAYHTILKVSVDFYSALKWARNITAEMSIAVNEVTGGTNEQQVFPYR